MRQCDWLPSQLRGAPGSRTKDVLCYCTQLKGEDAKLPGKQGFRFASSSAEEQFYRDLLEGWAGLGDWVWGFFSILMTEIHFTLECQDSLGCGVL